MKNADVAIMKLLFYPALEQLLRHTIIMNSNIIAVVDNISGKVSL